MPFTFVLGTALPVIGVWEVHHSISALDCRVLARFHPDSVRGGLVPVDEAKRKLSVDWRVRVSLELVEEGAGRK